ncbi:hypothetical protein ACTA71_000991 [Dictyostelium dimigraforme]
MRLYNIRNDTMHTNPKRKINSYMIRVDSCDPRLVTNFPKDPITMYEGDTFENKRKVIGRITRSRYDFWKLRRQFKLKWPNNIVSGSPVTVKVIVIKNGYHQFILLTSNYLKRKRNKIK